MQTLMMGFFILVGVLIGGVLISKGLADSRAKKRQALQNLEDMPFETDMPTAAKLNEMGGHYAQERERENITHRGLG